VLARLRRGASWGGRIALRETTAVSGFDRTARIGSVLLKDEKGTAFAYDVGEPARNYYSEVTRSEWMPGLVGGGEVQALVVSG
jgi:hypothetical protein